MSALMTPTYISWAPYCSRSDHTARELGGRSHMVYWAALGSNVFTVWLKYAGQAFRTLRILSAERPEAVFVMSPPVFAVLTVWWWCRRRGVPFVIDAHTAAFLHPRWKHLQWLQNTLARKAATTIVTNEHLAQRVRDAGAHATIVRDVPIRYADGESFDADPGFSVAVVCSFNADEPVGDILTAARALPDVRFYLTGDPARARRSDWPDIPDNVTLTGFLSTEAYGSLLRRADAVMTLTTRDHTMLRGAYEAVYQGTPVIVSDWPLLKASFDKGALHVDNSARAIAAAVREARVRRADLKAQVLELRSQKQRQWEEAKADLLARLEPSR